MILFIYPNFSTFVKNDYEILRKYSNIKKYHYQQGKTLLVHLLSQIKLLFWLIKNIWFADIIFCWFADYHSFLPVLFSKIWCKKFYVVLGGYDVVHIPEIDYGSFKNPLRGFSARFTIRYATQNLAVSEYVNKEALKYVHDARIVTVFNGLNTDAFIPGLGKKENIILTVGAGDTLQRIKLKGIDFFCKVARQIPQCSFIVIGVSNQAQKSLHKIPANFQTIEWLQFSELLKYYQKAKVYCQFSMLESFGIALAESMLCECMPVVCSTGALPEIVGEVGYVIKKSDTVAAVEAIEKALKKSEVIGKKARQRILDNFSSRKREEKLKEILGI